MSACGQSSVIDLRNPSFDVNRLSTLTASTAIAATSAAPPAGSDRCRPARGEEAVDPPPDLADDLRPLHEDLVPRALEVRQLAGGHPRDLPRGSPRSTPRSRRCRAAPASAASAAARRRAAPSPASAAEVHCTLGPPSASSGWAVIWPRHQAKTSGSEVSALPSKPTASAVGSARAPGVSRPPSPAMLASRVIRAVSSRVAAFICRCHIGAEKTAAAEVRRARAACAARCSRPSNARRDSSGPGSSSSATSVEQRRHVVLVVAEVLDMAEHRVGGCRSLSPWPRQSITATARPRATSLAADPAVLLDELGAAGEEHRRAAPAAAPDDRPQPHAVRRRQPEGPRPLRRVGDVGVEGGRRSCQQAARASSRAPCRRRSSAGRS